MSQFGGIHAMKENLKREKEQEEKNGLVGILMNEKIGIKNPLEPKRFYTNPTTGCVASGAEWFQDYWDHIGHFDVNDEGEEIELFPYSRLESLIPWINENDRK